MDEPAIRCVSTAEARRSDVGRERVYFPELDGLRFIAFLMVYLFHGGLSRSVQVALFGDSIDRIMIANGGYGVQFFFILSGFLITTLLVREERVFGRAWLRAFWVRRALRIWPLYYLIVGIGFFVLPALLGEMRQPRYREMLSIHLVPFLGFAGNWSMVLVEPIAYNWLSILWSVCVEEQFYLIAPLLIAIVGREYRIALVVGLMGVAIAVRYLIASRNADNFLIVLNTAAQFDTLLSGVLLALVLEPGRERVWLTRSLRVLQWPIYFAAGWVITQPQLGRGTVAHRTWDFVAVWLCGSAILIVAVYGQGWLQRALSYSRLVWLGKISYGLYMYHEMAILARQRLERYFPWFQNKEEILSIAAFVALIALAAGSYYSYERVFLRWKRSWTMIPSRPV